jgi:hypothetical protein
MQEVLTGIYHWTAFHEGIGEEVHSAFMASTEPPVLIDPRVPATGIDWFFRRPPRHAFLTNRHHYRHGDRFRQAFGTEIWCHRAGLHEFPDDPLVRPFDHGNVLPGGVIALPVGVLCPEETALLIPAAGGVLAIGDAIVRYGDDLGFVPDALLGDDPEAVKKGLRAVFLGHLERPFDHLLFAHGKPWIGGAREGLRRFLEGLRF